MKPFEEQKLQSRFYTVAEARVVSAALSHFRQMGVDTWAAQEAERLTDEIERMRQEHEELAASQARQQLQDDADASTIASLLGANPQLMTLQVFAWNRDAYTPQGGFINNATMFVGAKHKPAAMTIVKASGAQFLDGTRVASLGRLAALTPNTGKHLHMRAVALEKPGTIFVFGENDAVFEYSVEDQRMLRERYLATRAGK